MPVKKKVLAPTCATCRFYRPPPSAPAFRMSGQCRRYPEQVAKDAIDWCGEHAA